LFDVSMAAVQLVGMTWSSAVSDTLKRKLYSAAASILEAAIASDRHSAADANIR
jgi:hypothetical protein